MYLPSIFRSTTDHGPMESPDAPTSRRRSLFNLFSRRGARRRDPLEGSVPVYEPSESTPTRSTSNTLKSSFKGLSLRHRARAGIATATDTTLTLVSPPPSALDSSPISSGEPSPVSDSTAFTPTRSPVEKAEDALGHADRLAPRAAETAERSASGTWEAASSTADSWAGIVSKLGVFAGIVGGIGEIHPYLKAATSVINGITKPIVGQVARDEKFEQLLEEMKLAYDHVIREPAAALPRKKPDSRQTALLQDICRESEQCALFIQNEYIKTFWARTARNALYGDEVDDKIEQYKASFARLRARWQEEILLQLKGDTMLEKLSPMRHAGHSSQRACLAKTRVEVLKAIREWIDSPESPPVMFLLGVAGSGKSAIAHTVAETGHERGELGSFFAFNRNDATRVPERLLGTIAHNLAQWDETYRDWLVGLLKLDVMLADSPDIMKQWEHLIVEPASAISTPGPVLVVIDAFDECPELTDNSRQRLLDCLTSHAAELPNWFRVLVTSRPLDRVSQAMAASSVRRLDLSDFSAVEDIRLYVRDQIPLPTEGGLSDKECYALALAADGLFQWAATACRYLRGRLAGTTMSAKFTANLERLIHGDSGPSQRPHGPPSLDALYTAVLADTFDEADSTVMDNFRSVVAVLLCAAEHLSIDTLQSIYDRARPSNGGVVESVLGSMAIVLEGASNSGSRVRAMHLSFSEFLLNAARSGAWHISSDDLTEGHRTLALGGLRIMFSELKFNMHHLPSSRQVFYPRWYMEEIPDSQRAFAYSMLNIRRHLGWIDCHCNDTPGGELYAAVLDFLHHKFLFWLEWLSARWKLSIAGPTLAVAYGILRGEHMEDFKFGLDAAEFLRNCYNVIDYWPAHIYLSALPFTPAESRIRRQYIHQFPGIPVVSPVPATWNPLSQAMTQRPRVAWSMDGRYIRDDLRFFGIVTRCWDSRDGAAVDLPVGLEWRGPCNQSADGNVKVSFSFFDSKRRRRMEVRVERNVPETPAVTFIVCRPKTTNSKCWTDVSPDGRFLAITGWSPRRYCLWDLETGKEVDVPQYGADMAMIADRPTETVTWSLAFSPDSRELAVADTGYRTIGVYTVDRATVPDGPEPTSFVNFKPQPRVDSGGQLLPDADLRCVWPDIHVPPGYKTRLKQPGKRLLLGAEPITIDFSNACYGPEWDRCYAGDERAEASPPAKPSALDSPPQAPSRNDRRPDCVAQSRSCIGLLGI